MHFISLYSLLFPILVVAAPAFRESSPDRIQLSLSKRSLLVDEHGVVNTTLLRAHRGHIERCVSLPGLWWSSILIFFPEKSYAGNRPTKKIHSFRRARTLSFDVMQTILVPFLWIFNKTFGKGIYQLALHPKTFKVSRWLHPTLTVHSFFLVDFDTGMWLKATFQPSF